MACPDPGTPENGRRQIESLHGGSTVHYSCFDGYKLVGESKRTCHSGRWTGSLPSCSGECLGVATIIGLWVWVLFVQAGAIINRMCVCLWTNRVIKSVVHLVHFTGIYNLFCFQLVCLWSNGNKSFSLRLNYRNKISIIFIFDVSSLTYIQAYAAEQTEVYPY